MTAQEKLWFCMRTAPYNQIQPLLTNDPVILHLLTQTILDDNNIKNGASELCKEEGCNLLVSKESPQLLLL